MEKIKQNKDFGYLLNRLIAKPRNKKPGSSGYIPPTLHARAARWYAGTVSGTLCKLRRHHPSIDLSTDTT